MPPTNADDPFRTTDHAAHAATPSTDHSTDAVPGSSVEAEHTGPFVSDAVAHLPADPGRPAAPVSVPGYEIERVLGRGGMGVVYKARHLALKRTVALKMVLAGGHAGPRELTRFRIEAEAAARLQHPNIVQIHEVGEAGGHPYCALEFVDGGNLAARLKSGSLPALEAAMLVQALAHAMQLAHSRNVVHRDLKPANVLLAADGTPKITDFGLARQTDSDSGQTQAGVVMGTPSYMAPEQASGRGHEAGPAADVYALGAILYECLTGRPPFRGDSIVETLDQVRTQEPAPPSRWRSGVPLDLATICLKCLRKEPEKRYTSAAALAEDLVRYQRGEPILARAVGRLERAAKWVKRNPVVAGAATAAVLAVVAGATASYVKYRETETALRERNTALGKANEALARESERADERDKANAELRHRLGIGEFLLAVAAYNQRDVKLAAERLEKVPAEQRGWEWHYLKKLTIGGILTLSGHKNPVSCVAFSSDGKRIVSGAGSQNVAGEVRVWDAQTGQLLLDLEGLPVLQGVNIPVMNVAFSPDGTRLVTRGTQADKHGAAKVWDARTGKFLLELDAHSASVQCVAFNSDGTRIATGNSDGTLLVFEARTGKLLLKLNAHQISIPSVSFSPDGTRIATVSDDQTLKVWDAKKGGNALLELKGIFDSESTVAFNPDGTRIVIGLRDGTAKILDTNTGTVLLVLEESTRGADSATWSQRGVLCASFSRDGARIVTAGGVHGPGEATVWDAKTGKALLELIGHTEVVMSAAFSPDGTRIATSSVDQTVKVWDARTGTARLQLTGDRDDVLSVACSPDGKRIVTAEGIFENPVEKPPKATTPSKAVIWDAQSGKALVVVRAFPGTLKCVAFSRDGTRIVTGGVAYQKLSEHGRSDVSVGQATVWDAKTGKALLELKGFKEGVHSVAFSPDGARIITGAIQDLQDSGTEVKVWDAHTGEVLLDLSDPPTEQGVFMNMRGGSVAFSSDGAQILIAGIREKKSWRGETAKVCDAQTGAVLVELQGDVGPVMSAAFSPDGTRILTGGRGTVKMWDARTGTLQLDRKNHAGNVNSVAFDSNGTRFVTGSGDRTVKVWDAETGTELLELRGHTGFIMSVAFSPDGTRIVSGSGGEAGKPGEVIVWDAQPVSAPRKLKGHPDK